MDIMNIANEIKVKLKSNICIANVLFICCFIMGIIYTATQMPKSFHPLKMEIQLPSNDKVRPCRQW